MKKSYWIYGVALFIILIISAQPLLAQNDFSLNPNKRIKFISEPSRYGQVGVAYNYTAVAVSADTTAVIRYYTGSNVPDGFSIDSVTGVVNWIPQEKGWFVINLYAASTKSNVAVQNFIVSVVGGNGIVQGRVIEALNNDNGIPHIIIEVLQATNTSITNIGCYSYLTRTDENGYYRISNIDPGKYKIRAISPTPKYESQWYDGKDNPADADVVTILDSVSTAPTIIDFKLRGGVEILPLVNVSGVVTDENLQPIKPTTNIFFVRYGFALNCKDTTDDYRESFNLGAWRSDFKLDGRSHHVYHAKGDTLGNYSLKIPRGVYIAFAKAPGYSKEFYLDKSDILSANLIVLKDDSSGINFTLIPIPTAPLGTIEGQVIDSSLDIGVPSRIIATRDRWTSGEAWHSFRSYVVDTDSLGRYTIDSLLPGSYIVFALPLGNYTPAFYTNDTLSTRWKKASRVLVNGNTVDDINIYVRRIPVIANGYSKIFGKVRCSSASETAAGAFVYAYRNGEPAGYAITDDRGKYSVEGLAPGEYTISVDRLGCQEAPAVSATVSYSITGKPDNASVDFSIDVTTGVEQPASGRPVKFVLMQNYPNPFNPSTAIDYTLDRAGIVTLKVYNLLGQEVYTLVDGYQNAGSYHTTFNAKGLSSGIYFYRLKTQNAVQTRKMILLQ
ncbi:MAG: T9SS type A sorting domain-containing protein [Bacteroidetes bacterium]|nr:T9SS type A sorting domain-containing protein [Bacteroidota bacterium]